MIITFLGHSMLSNDEGVREKIKRAIEKNIRDGEKTVFYCGGYGDFDTVCSSVCRSLRKEWMIDKSELVIAYVDREYGGAYKGLQYALRKKKRIENLARPALGNE